MASFTLPDRPRDPDFARPWRISAPKSELKDLSDLGHLLTLAQSEVMKLRSCIAVAEVGFDKSKIPPGGTPSINFDEQNFWFYWRVAGAECSISAIYQFAYILSSVLAWSQSSPAVKYLTDANAAKSSNELFIKYFPKWEVTRHATAHSGEIAVEVDKNVHIAGLSRSSITKPKGFPMQIHYNFENRTFITTRKGELLRFEVTWDTYLKLKSVYDTLIEGMTPKTAQPEPG